MGALQNIRNHSQKFIGRLSLTEQGTATTMAIAAAVHALTMALVAAAYINTSVLVIVGDLQSFSKGRSIDDKSLFLFSAGGYSACSRRTLKLLLYQWSRGHSGKSFLEM